MKNKNYLLNTNSITIKIALIAFLALLMLIPITMIKSMIKEREGNKTAEQAELDQKWGGTQEVSGPILVLPYRNNAGEGSKIQYLYSLPDEYMIDGKLNSEERTRGIQKILSYQSEMQISGTYKLPDYSKFAINDNDILWDEVCFVVGISNLQGIKNNLKFNLNGKVLEVFPELNENIRNDLKTAGLTAKIPKENIIGQQTIKFNFDLTLNGANGIYFNPIGKHSDIKLISNWESVSFIGQFVPDEKELEKGGFSAQWSLFEYNRDYKQTWTGKNHVLKNMQVGVDLLLPVNHYQKTMRAVKFALLFIVLTFLVFFIVEILSDKRIHPIQYLLVSLALILFYSLLLALSEHLSFILSYSIAALATIILITAYSKTVFKNWKQTFFMGGFLTALYVFLYIVLQQEDMALLLGSIGLFISLAIVMYVSRKIDWYKKDENIKKEVPK